MAEGNGGIIGIFRPGLMKFIVEVAKVSVRYVDVGCLKRLS